MSSGSFKMLSKECVYKPYIFKKYIGCVNIHGTHVTANESAYYNVVFFFVSDLKTVYYNNY